MFKRGFNFTNIYIFNNSELMVFFIKNKQIAFVIIYVPQLPEIAC